LFWWGQKWCQNFFDLPKISFFQTIPHMLYTPSLPLYLAPSLFSQHTPKIPIKKDKKYTYFFGLFFLYITPTKTRRQI